MWPGKSIESALAKSFQIAAKYGFSGVALVRHRGNILLREAAGMANREINNPNSIDTVFDIGSITCTPMRGKRPVEIGVTIRFYG